MTSHGQRARHSPVVEGGHYSVMSRFKKLSAGLVASLRSFGRRRTGHPVGEAGDAQVLAPLVDRVLRSISNNSLVLHHEGCQDTAALLRHMGARIAASDDPAWSFYPIHVDLRGIPEEGFFDALGDATFAALASHLAGMQPEDCSRPPGDLGFRRLSRNLRRVVAELAGISSKRVKVVLLVHGIEQLNHYHPRVNQKLRSLFMTGLSENLVAVAAGGAIDRRWDRDGSPWYNFFEEVAVVGPGATRSTE